jgi:uncharacterized protein
MTNRDSFPDVLRGFALLGIALVNIPLLAIDPILHNEGADLSIPSNAAGAFIVMAFFQAKFYLLFSFLFGYSAHYVLKDSKENRGRWIGRSIGLVLLGILHFSLLFFGDILFLYGLFGLLLLVFYFRKAKTLKIWAWVIYIISALSFAALSALTLVGEYFLASKGQSIPGLDLGDFSNVMTSQSFVESIGFRLELWLTAAPTAFALQGPPVLIAFLVGVLAARGNFLGADAKASTMKKFAIWGFTLGLPLQLFSAYLFVQNAVSDTYSLGLYLSAISLNFMTAPLLSAGYIGALWLLNQKLKFVILASAGRYSLTIYLSQSVVFATLFSGWGFGFSNQLGVLPVTLIAAATWFILALIAHQLIRAGRRGPMETLLTSFSKLFVGKQ